jgi:hypothetical protein
MGIPALACLPNQRMTQGEMACCKKMAGDCQMSVGQHPCCKTNLNSAVPAVKVEHDASQVQPNAVATPLSIVTLSAETVDRAYTNVLGLPPPVPPDLNSVVRI